MNGLSPIVLLDKQAATFKYPGQEVWKSYGSYLIQLPDNCTLTFGNRTLINKQESKSSYSPVVFLDCKTVNYNYTKPKYPFFSVLKLKFYLRHFHYTHLVLDIIIINSQDGVSLRQFRSKHGIKRSATSSITLSSWSLWGRMYYINNLYGNTVRKSVRCCKSAFSPLRSWPTS